MKKLVNGVVEFRKKIVPSYRETFKQLALGQSPDTLLIACSDSRVVPNLFASTDPGDMFVLRNIGNLIPPVGDSGERASDRSEGAVIEFALAGLGVSDIVVCGHSECGAMRAIYEGRTPAGTEHLRSWLRHGNRALENFKAGRAPDLKLEPHNQLSQINVLQQLEHIQSYPLVRERMQAGKVRLHGWWFDIANADVYAYEPELGKFVILDEVEADRICKRLGFERC